MRKCSSKFVRKSSKFKIGQVFDRLTIVSDDGMRTKHGKRLLLCSCACGNNSIVTAALLVNGNTRSCGCLQNELRRSGFRKTHGDRDTTEYNTWVGIIARCTNPKGNRWQHYGGRGITMCERWRNSYEDFLSDMGRKPSRRHSIDRIDVNGNYEPDNCRWATPSEQRRNRRPALEIST